MSGWLGRNPAIAALGALAVALVLAIALETKFGATPASFIGAGSARRAAPPEAKLLPPLALAAPEQTYPETAARPLFTPTRRPAPEAPATPQATFQKGQFVLQGVIAVGSNRIAMLREKANGRLHRVELGREINGIKVVDIQPETVTLAQGGEQEQLGLTVQKAPVGAAAAVSQGPFAAPAGQGAPPAAPPTSPAQPTPGSTFPRPAPVPGAPAQNVSQAGAFPSANPAARATPDTAVPLSPEELLARRRARRTQQTQ